MVGLSCVTADELAGGDAARNVEIFGAVLAGETGPLRDIVVLNTAAALVVTEIAGGHARRHRAGCRVDRQRSGTTRARHRAQHRQRGVNDGIRGSASA